MWTKKLVVVVAVLALVLGTLSLGSYMAPNVEAKAKGATLEYRLIGMRLQPRSVMEEGKKRLMADNIEMEFNFQADEGWEYVNTFPGKDDAIFMVFKRSKM